jgi:hypothetical protein
VRCGGRIARPESSRQVRILQQAARSELRIACPFALLTGDNSSYGVPGRKTKWR